MHKDADALIKLARPDQGKHLEKDALLPKGKETMLNYVT